METSQNTITQTEQNHSVLTELTLGRGTDDELTYDIPPLLKERENSLNGYDIITRAKELDAHLGMEHKQYFLNHQAEVPAELRDHIFIFTDDSLPGRGGAACISDVYWNRKKNSWETYWSGRGLFWNNCAHVLRPRQTLARAA